MNNILFKILMLKGDAGEPTDEQTQSAVDDYMHAHPEAAIDETIINSAVGDWLDEHPEATTTVQDGSLTDSKFTDVLKHKTLNAYVTPEMFGAKGDGTTDDTDAIISAFNFCKTNKVYLYASEKTYKTTETCILDFESNSFDVVLNGTFDYLEFRGTPSIMQFANIHVHNVDTVKFVNFLGVHVDIDYANNAYVVGDSTIRGNGGCSYNYFTGIMYRNIYLQANGTGWVNENKFYSMRCITLSISGSASHAADNNRFYDICLENGTIAFNLAQSNYIQLRGEGGVTYTETSSYNNIVEQTWTSTKNGYGLSSVSDGKTLRTNQFAKYLQFKNIYDLTVNNYYHADNDYDAFKMAIKPNVGIARIYVKLDSVSLLHLFSDIKSFTISLRILDADLQNITAQNMLSDVFRLNGGVFQQNGSDPYFYLGSTMQNDLLITLDKQTDGKWAKVNLYNTGSTVYPRTIKAELASLSHVPYFIEYSFGDALRSNAKPTTTKLPLGTIVEDSTGATKGWVYQSSGWTAIS